MPTAEVVFLLFFHALSLEIQSLQTHKGLLKPQVLPIKAGEAHPTTEGRQHWEHNTELLLPLCALSFMRNSSAKVEKLQVMLQTHRLRTEGRQPCNTAEGERKETKKPNSDAPHILVSSSPSPWLADLFLSPHLHVALPVPSWLANRKRSLWKGFC